MVLSVHESPFLPRALSGLGPITPAAFGMTWYRPDSESVSIATGVSQFRSKNGGTALSQATPAIQPSWVASRAAFNNQPVIAFGGAGQRLAAPSVLPVRPATFWWVGSWSAGGSVLCVQYFATSFIVVEWDAVNFRWTEGGGSAQSANGGYPACFAITADAGTGIVFYRNGVQVGTGVRAIAAAGAGSSFALGADIAGAAASVGDLADVAFAPRVMSAAQILALTNAYTKPRYGF